MKNNKKSYMSNVIQDLYNNNEGYSDIVYHSSSESFTISPANIVTFFIEADIKRPYIII